MQYYRTLANCAEEAVSQLADRVLQRYASSRIELLSGPRQGLVMLRMQESVADSQFNAGEILVTEVRLELDGQFGFGMVLGDSPKRALAIALIDAAIRRGGPFAQQLLVEIEELDQQLTQEHLRLQARIATTKVDFERM